MTLKGFEFSLFALRNGSETDEVSHKLVSLYRSCFIINNKTNYSVDILKCMMWVLNALII